MEKSAVEIEVLVDGQPLSLEVFAPDLVLRASAYRMLKQLYGLTLEEVRYLVSREADGLVCGGLCRPARPGGRIR